MISDWGNERGVIAHRERARQISDFSELRFNNITPTDIDAFTEYKDKAFMFVEFKHVSNPGMKTGQTLAFERLCRDLRKPRIFFLCTHNAPITEDIPCGRANVISYFYWTKRIPQWSWRDPVGPIMLKDAANLWLSRFD